MRRGIGRARLCDVAPCPNRWPCSVHGTRRVGDYEHLGRHAGEVAIVAVDMRGALAVDMRPCDVCGYALCSCTRCESCGGAVEKARHVYAHPTCYKCLPPPPPIPVVTVDRARRHITQTMRPGWTYDGESYFNDAIALMVARMDGGWCVVSNGAQWERGWHSTPYDLAELAMQRAEEAADQVKWALYDVPGPR